MKLPFDVEVAEKILYGIYYLTRLKQFGQVIMLEVNIVVRGCTLEKVMQTILIVKIVYNKDYFHI